MQFAEIMQSTACEVVEPIDVEKRIEALKAACEKIQNEHAWGIGDLVTPSASSALHGAGEPHIVVDVDFTVPRNWFGDPCLVGVGGKYNTRVASFLQCGDQYHILLHWVEGHLLVAFTDKHLSKFKETLKGISDAVHEINSGHKRPFPAPQH